jgi:hypothetical protein
MTAVAVEVPFELPRGLDSALRRPEPAREGAIEPWELHSELVLVCPEVRRALELLPDRDPVAAVARPRPPRIIPAGSAEEVVPRAGLPATALEYALWRLVATARSGLLAASIPVAVALLAEALH